MTKPFAITGPTLYTEQGIIPEGNIVINQGKIESINGSLRGIDSIIELPSHWHLVPGMINLHIHGMQGAELMDGHPDSIRTISQALPASGVTCFIISTMTDSPQHIEQALANVNAFSKNTDRANGSHLLGVHLEGPFISKEACGAQKIEHVLAPNIALFEHWQAVSGHQIRIVTLAPEVDPECQFIRYLHHQGIVIAIGHSKATYEQTEKAIQAGCTYSTHLFNAMHPLHHRDPGCVAAILNNPNVLAEIITDGIHLHPAIVQLVLKLKGPDRTVLVSDGLKVTGLPDGTYSVDGNEVILKNHEARLLNGSLAGSVLTLDQALRNFMAMTQCSLSDAIKTVTEAPAKCLGLFDQIGSIRENKNADLVVLNENLNIEMTFCHGELTFRSQGSGTRYQDKIIHK